MGNFFDGDAASPPPSSHPLQWFWCKAVGEEEDESAWTAFSADLSSKIEAASKAKSLTVDLGEEGKLDIQGMQLKSKNGTLHPVRRGKAKNAGPLQVKPPPDERMVKLDQAKLEKLLAQEFPDRPGPATDRVALCKKLTNWKPTAAMDHECPICLCDLDEDVVTLEKCPGHPFHRDCIVHCLKEEASFLKCPCCGVLYGVRTGVMPKGTISISRSATRLEGYYLCGSITINYNFSDGIQGPEHPNPGESYTGTSRTAYLPDNAEGNEVLRLLQLAWDRRLTFTIGTSVTNGTSNTVIWNGVHHKTSTSGGMTNYGYPDETYLERVTEELKDLGVV